VTGQRPAEPGEVCSCGRPAIVVYLTEAHGPVPYCGIPDGGQAPPVEPDDEPDRGGAVEPPTAM